MTLQKTPTPRAGNLVILSDYVGAGGAHTGGVGIAVVESYKILKALGARVRMIGGFDVAGACTDDPGVSHLGGEDLRAGSRARMLSAIYNPQSRRKLEEALAAYDPGTTVIVLHQWTRWLSPSVMRLISGFKVMVYMHDYFWACPNGAYYNFPRQRPCALQPMGLACVASQCDRSGYAHKAFRLARHAVKDVMASGGADDRLILHLSEASRSLMQPLMPKEQHRVIHNPLSAGAVAAGSDEEPRYDVGYFGRLEPEKGVPQLLKALERGGYTGLFVGDGSLSEALSNASGDIASIRWSPHAQSLQLMRRCRVVALPSLWPETWGLVTAEALAQGVPVVVSARAGSSELVTRFGGGAVFDPGDANGLFQALRSVLTTSQPAGQAAAVALSVKAALAPPVHGRRIIDLARETWALDLCAA